MSYTELYAFDKTGKAKLFGTVHNAWRGAMRVWRIMEERYLPLYIPDFVKCSWCIIPKWMKMKLLRSSVSNHHVFQIAKVRKKYGNLQIIKMFR